MGTIINDRLKTRPLTGKIYFTVDDISHLPEFPEGPPIEIYNGELYMVPSPSTKHQIISKNLTLILGNFLKKNTLGQLFYAPTDVVLSEDNLVIPNLLLILNNNVAIIQDKNILGVPDLLIEILLSNRAQDLERKKSIYEQFKVPEYWIIDPIEQIVMQFQLSNNRYLEPTFYGIGDYISPLSLHNMKIAVIDIFEDVK
jgi:Uma2 family endonuclease